MLGHGLAPHLMKTRSQDDAVPTAGLLPRRASLCPAVQMLCPPLLAHLLRSQTWSAEPDGDKEPTFSPQTP